MLFPMIPTSTVSCAGQKLPQVPLWHLWQTRPAVPGQVKVVTFNNEYSPYLCPPVTALYLNPAEVTQRAVEQLCRLQDPAERMITKQIAIQPALIVRPLHPAKLVRKRALKIFTRIVHKSHKAISAICE